jgi:hypothetical protein
MSDIHPDIAIANPYAEMPRDDEPMTLEQMAELLCLSQRAEEPDAYDETLSRFEADNRILLLKRKPDG